MYPLTLIRLFSPSSRYFRNCVKKKSSHSITAKACFDTSQLQYNGVRGLTIISCHCHQSLVFLFDLIVKKNFNLSADLFGPCAVQQGVR